MSMTKRPTTCGALFAVTNDEQIAAKGCKRLPRHGGEHRAFLTLAAARRAAKPTAKVVRKAAPKGRKASKATLNDVVRDIRAQVGQPRGRLNAAKRREAIGLLNAAAIAGRITFGDALGLTARF